MTGKLSLPVLTHCGQCANASDFSVASNLDGSFCLHADVGERALSSLVDPPPEWCPIAKTQAEDARDIETLLGRLASVETALDNLRALKLGEQVDAARAETRAVRAERDALRVEQAAAVEKAICEGRAQERANWLSKEELQLKLEKSEDKISALQNETEALRERLSEVRTERDAARNLADEWEARADDANRHHIHSLTDADEKTAQLAQLRAREPEIREAGAAALVAWLKEQSGVPYEPHGTIIGGARAAAIRFLGDHVKSQRSGWLSEVVDTLTRARIDAATINVVRDMLGPRKESA